MKLRRWCYAILFLCLCYCSVLYVGLHILDAEQASTILRTKKDQPWEHIHTAHTLTPLTHHHLLPCPPPPPTCHPTTTNNNRSVIVVGALQAVGAWLAVQLSGSLWTVTALAHHTDISTNRLVWYRRQQLSGAGIEVTFLNLSNSSQVQSLLSLHPSHVVYVPAGLECEATPRGSAYWGSHMSGFVALLEAFKCSTFILASLGSGDSHMTIQRAHMTSFEAVLLAYHDLYIIQYTIIRSGPVYGPWTQHSLSLLHSHSSGAAHQLTESSWYISDVTDALSSALHQEPLCDQLDLVQCNKNHTVGTSLDLTSEQKELIPQQQPVEKGLKKTLHWARAYQRQVLESSNNDIILTSYFTSREDVQRNKTVSPNRVRYMLDWLVSVRDLGLRAVVFHDQLEPRFMRRVTEYHPEVTFQYVPPPLNRTTNDARFYAYLAYLRSHPNLDRLLLTDISDVRFQRNPFTLMRLLGDDWLYIGTDIDFFPNMGSQRWISEHLEGCFGSHTLLSEPLKRLMNQDTVFNAGVIGGSHHMMQSLLESIVLFLNKAPPSLNCNMPAVNFAVHQHFHKQVFTGFPLTSRFHMFQSSPKGVFIVHK